MGKIKYYDNEKRMLAEGQKSPEGERQNKLF